MGSNVGFVPSFHVPSFHIVKNHMGQLLSYQDLLRNTLCYGKRGLHADLGPRTAYLLGPVTGIAADRIAIGFRSPILSGPRNTVGGSRLAGALDLVRCDLLANLRRAAIPVLGPDPELTAHGVVQQIPPHKSSRGEIAYVAGVRDEHSEVVISSLVARKGNPSIT